MILFLIGLFCFLLAVGFFVTRGENPMRFAMIAMVAPAALEGFDEDDAVDFADEL